MTATHTPSTRRSGSLGLMVAMAAIAWMSSAMAAAPSSQPAASPPPTTAPAAEEPAVIKVFNLKYVDTKTVVNAINTAWGDQTARVTPGPGNSVVVRAKQASMMAIQELLSRLDIAPDPSRENRVVIMVLKNAKPTDLASVIAKLVPGIRECIPWSVTNSLLIAGTPQSIETSEMLIAQLDVAPPVRPVPEPPRPPVRVTQVFAVRYTLPGNALVNALKTAAGPGTSIELDSDSGSIIVTGLPESLAAIEKIIAQVDRPSSRPESSAVRLRIRFLWLVSGLAEDKSSPPPADLMPLLEELQRIGVSGLRLAAQNVIEGMPGHDFRVKASPLLTNRCDLQLDGRILDQNNGSQPCIELSARVTEYAPYMEPEKNGYKVVEQRNLCSLETTVVAPMGKTIVAGIAPMDRMTAVFVVQVLPQ